MKKELLLHKFNSSTTGKKHIDARRIIDNELISNINIENDDFIIEICGDVISENLMSTYITKLEIDKNSLEVLSTYCSCSEYEKFEFSKNNYCCKHLIATFYSSLDIIESNVDFNDIFKANKSLKSNNIDILSELIDIDNKEELKFEIYINKEEWSGSLKAEFKIGSTITKKYYIIRDIEQFLVHYYNKIPLSFGKTFTFDMKRQKFSDYNLKIIEFIEMLNEIDGPLVTLHRKDKRLVNGKYIKIPDYLIRIFFERISSNRVYLNEGFFFKAVECNILFENPPLNLILKLKENVYKLSYNNELPQRLSKNEDVFVYSTNIYIPDFKFCISIKSFLKVFDQNKNIEISEKQETEILSKLLPTLKSLSSDLYLSKNIKDKIIDKEAILKFYLDKKRDKLVLNVMLNYDEIEFNIFENYNKKFIYRDIKKENLIKGLIFRLGFNQKDNYYIFSKDENYLFKLFKEDILKLQEQGEVFYSENVKTIKNISKADFSGEISPGKDDYFDFKFSVSDIPRDEIINIIDSLRNKVIYHKLKNGEFLDLEAVELKKFLQLVNSLIVDDNFNGENVRFTSNKACFVSDSITSNNMSFINGNNHLLDIKDKILNIENLKFELPLNLNAKLREYQKFGFNWLSTLDYLKCGGILADEMGLGKTLQTIAFILSKKNTKTLIVTPTSLVYNWANEIEKFAPDLKYIVNIGVKDDRADIKNKLDNFDIILTTYGVLKNDLNEYVDITFDYIIIDEAQNIKNPKSQNALAVKSLKSNMRFALTGTPIENSVLELWSIFDFIMPLYLRNQKDFNTRYNKNLNENRDVLNELHMFISPFILRRYKKDVIKELPDKIVKEIFIPLSDKQKKIYASYSKYVSDIINKNKDSIDDDISRIEILSYITKLRQLCLDPNLLIDDYDEESSKIEALLELLEDNISTHKILIFSQFTSILKNIGKKLKELKIDFSYLDGSMHVSKRMKAIEDFDNDVTNIFLISTKAGGTGLNLTSADIVIHFDPWWNPAVEDQATDRAHRLGQENVVEVIKLIAKDTIEEKILKLQERKKALIDSIINDTDKNNIIGKLSFEEILELI